MFTETQSNPGASCNNVITRSCTATDTCRDLPSFPTRRSSDLTTAPVLSGCPSPTLSVQCLSGVPAAATVTAMDNCSGVVPVTFNETQSNPGSSCNNVITRTWTAVDSCGNTASCSQTITVNDTT